MDTQVLTVSSKGQISLPVEMRRQLSIDTGDKLAAYPSGDVIILKPISIPAAKELEARLDEELREKYGITDEEIYVGKYVKEFRRKRHEQS